MRRFLALLLALALLPGLAPSASAHCATERVVREMPCEQGTNASTGCHQSPDQAPCPMPTGAGCAVSLCSTTPAMTAVVPRLESRATAVVAVSGNLTRGSLCTIGPLVPPPRA